MIDEVEVQANHSVTINGSFANQPIGEFFVGVIPAATLTRIAYSDVRRLVEREVEVYSGINRPISKERIKEIREYIGSVDATFPNSIIIAIDSENILEQTDNSLTIRISEEVAKIIDGQHRLKGLEETQPQGFDLVVSIFVDMDIEDQAMIFSVINLKQTKVSKSLVYDLFELTTKRSPQKTCHTIAKSLNADETSPFYRRIKLLGKNPKVNGGEALYKAPLTQAAFIKYLLPAISANPDRDRNLLLEDRTLELPADAVGRGLIFRKYFVDGDDVTIIRIVDNYFSAIRDTFVQEWADLENPISKTIGYGALMRLLRDDLYPKGEAEKNFSREFFVEHFQRAAGNIDLRFAPEGRYAPAGKGETDLYNDLRRLVTNA